MNCSLTRHKLRLFFVLIIATFASELVAAPVVLLDFSPLDRTHPMIADHVNVSTWSNSNVIWQDHHRVSLESINDSLIKAATRNIDPDSFRTLAVQSHGKSLTDMPGFHRLMAFRRNELHHEFEMNGVRGTIPAIAHDFDAFRARGIFQYLTHGTFVASVMTQSLPSVQLIHVPIPFLMIDPTKPSRFSGDPDHLIRESIHSTNLDQDLSAYFESVTELLRQHAVKVVVLCLNGSPKSLYDRLILQLGHFLDADDPLDEAFQLTALHQASLFRSKVKMFIQANPERIFVMSAGNQGSRLDEAHFLLHTKATINEPNLLKVTALFNSKSLPRFANYSSLYIDVGALGVGILGALQGYQTFRVSGTSASAPQVAAKIQEIEDRHPHFSIAQILNEFYFHEVNRIPELVSSIKHGSVLRACNSALESNEASPFQILTF